MSDPLPVPKRSALQPDPGGVLVRRAMAALPRRRDAVPVLLASEHVGAFAVPLPRASARQRQAMLAYAIEDRVAAPLDTLQVVAGPSRGIAPLTLILVAARGVLATLPDAPGGILPDVLLVPRPDAAPGDSAWAILRDGDRAVVRLSDGTGFATSTDLLPMLWGRAGRPAATSLGDALPPEITATDLSADPPAPDLADLVPVFTHPRRAGQTGALRPLIAAALVLGVGLGAHLGIAALDALALARIAEGERALADAAIAPMLPGVTIGPDTGPILARLAPAAPLVQGSDLLPVLAEVSAALTGTGVTFRRLAWGKDDGQVTALVQAAGLDGLQDAQQRLQAAGFTVRAGAASVGDGGAEVEMRIVRGAS